MTLHGVLFHYPDGFLFVPEAELKVRTPECFAGYVGDVRVYCVTGTTIPPYTKEVIEGCYGGILPIDDFKICLR